nr:phage capsid protein [Bacteriovorax sp. HI3]
MSTTIDQAFIQQYDTDLHLAYQQHGSKLRDFVRKKSGVSGEKVTFQKYGKGEATQKTRHGAITPMNPVHTKVAVTLEDWYAGDYVDKLDEYKVNIDERQAILSTGAGALGRKVDAQLIAAAYTSTNIINQATNTFSLDVLFAGIEAMLGADVFEGADFDVTVVLKTKQWLALHKIDEFKSADYRKQNGQMDMKIAGVKQFMGMNFVHSNLLATATGVSDCIIFDKRSLGLGEAKGTETDIWWNGEKASHFVNSMMSSGAVLVDALGCGILKVKD